MKTLEISYEDFEALKDFVIRKRCDWPAAFSMNFHGELWPFIRWGYTPEAERENCSGLNSILDEICQEFLDARPSGGRFFINEQGAWTKPYDRDIQFVEFEYIEVDDEEFDEKSEPLTVTAVQSTIPAYKRLLEKIFGRRG